MFQPTYSIGERLAGFAAGQLREKADKPKLDIARRAHLASQSFPNDRFVRQPRREEKPVEPNTPERNRHLLALAYSHGATPIIMPRKPSRRERIIRRRIAEGRMRRPLKDHPLGQRDAIDEPLLYAVNVLGKRCEVAIGHLRRNAEVNNARDLARTLSVSRSLREKQSKPTALESSGYQTMPA